MARGSQVTSEAAELRTEGDGNHAAGAARQREVRHLPRLVEDARDDGSLVRAECEGLDERAGGPTRHVDLVQRWRPRARRAGRACRARVGWSWGERDNEDEGEGEDENEGEDEGEGEEKSVKMRRRRR